MNLEPETEKFLALSFIGINIKFWSIFPIFGP